MSKKSIIPQIVEAASNRRSFVRKLGVAGAAVGAMGTAAEVADAATGLTPTDVQVLNFALNLEYLESTVYSYGVNGTDITAFGIGISGVANGNNPASGGVAVGGQKVNSQTTSCSRAISNHRLRATSARTLSCCAACWEARP